MAKGKKPTFYLLKPRAGGKFTPEDVAAMYDEMMGTKTTPAELEEIRRCLAAEDMLPGLSKASAITPATAAGCGPRKPRLRR